MPFRKLSSALLLACTMMIANVAPATTFSVNYSDLWWDAAEPGWGVNLSQQADVILGTIFVYGEGERAAWYSTTLNYQSTGVDGALTFKGDLFLTSGSPAGTPWDSARLKYRQVGTATLTFGDGTHALLVYTVDGTPVSKQISRQTLRAESLAGVYIGGTTDITFNCSPPSRNNLLTTDPGQLTITQIGDNVTILAPTCTYTGKYVQHGQLGEVAGSYTCTNGALGMTTFRAMKTEQGGLVGTYTGKDSSCEFRGNIGGMRLLQ